MRVRTIIVVGLLTFYGRGVMDSVVDYRMAIGQIDRCAHCVGAVALLEPEHIGKTVWLEWPDGTVEGPFMVADCAQAAHVAGLRARGWAVDVDWETAQRHGVRAPVSGIIVWNINPKKDGTPVPY